MPEIAVGKFDQGYPVTEVEELANWLRRLCVPKRFRPIILWLRDGTRLDVLMPEDIHVHVDDGTIEVATQEGWRPILLEDLMSVGLPPR